MGQTSFSTCQRLDPCLLYGLPLRPQKYDLDHWKLRSLELRGCTFVLDSPAFGNLLELSKGCAPAIADIWGRGAQDGLSEFLFISINPS